LGISHADSLCRRGRLDEARRLVEVVEEANSNPGAGVSAFTALPRALLALETGDAGAAEALCDLLSGSLLKDMPDHCPIHWIWVWKVRAELALDKGQVDVAAELAVRMSTRAAKAGIVHPAVGPWADTAMAAFLRAGRHDDAEGLARYLETVTAAWPGRWPPSVAEGGRAGLAEVRKEYQEAEGHHRRAIDLLEEVQLPLASVRALVGYGMFLRRSGRPAQARTPLGRAVEEAHACGATRLAAHALVELHASGGRRGRGGNPELSHQEQRTAKLAAQGATNAEIAATLAVSVKTVEHYLSSTYRKLGIRSRRELPDADGTFRT
jgi:ATP/maltotriose-dependent transcriptional regulator MalT